MTSVEVLFLDVDDTLYPRTNGLWQAIGERILGYLTDRVGLTSAEAERVRASYLERYGTTLSGLIRHHGVDPLDYLRVVHNLPLREYLSPDPRLRCLLEGISSRKVIFTNAHREHVERVLACLEVEDTIDQIVDLLALRMFNKPDPNAYRIVLELAGDPDPVRCGMVDDRLRNLLPASRLGVYTVLVGPLSEAEGVDARIEQIYDLPRVLPTP
ncbi:MAG: pyrimidine 5'-nucleotidase [Anaerolineales bacterium]